MRNRSRLGVLVLALPLVVAPFAGAIAGPATQPEKDGADTQTQSQPKSQNPAEKKKPAGGAGKESPIEPFIPSETISADSAVSFPVDI
jgi:hypothetical protein